MRAITIVVVDDNSIFRKILCDFVKSLGQVKVIGEALDGDHAIEVIYKLRPDMVLMDISMPNKTGLEAAKVIKSKYPEVFIAVITLHDGAIYRKLAKECLADDFILKNEMKTKLTALILQRLQIRGYEA